MIASLHFLPPTSTLLSFLPSAPASTRLASPRLITPIRIATPAGELNSTDAKEEGERERRTNQETQGRGRKKRRTGKEGGREEEEEEEAEEDEEELLGSM